MGQCYNDGFMQRGKIDGGVIETIHAGDDERRIKLGQEVCARQADRGQFSIWASRLFRISASIRAFFLNKASWSGG
jgi:hypothetical protein